MGKIIISFVLVLLTSCNSKNNNEVNYSSIVGETITLTNQEYNTLYYKDIYDLKLYTILPSGNKVLYEIDNDYIVSQNRIKRTENSLIPNFANHKVTLTSDGKFSWSPEPNRNPELTIPYQIYADYNYIDKKEVCVPTNKISQKLYSKLLLSKSIKLVAVGTSITFGSHTFEHYYNNSDKQTYYKLISKSISKLYNLECQTVNSSTDGGGVNQILDMQPILDEKPDAVLIELGMNDHLRENPNIDYYKSSLENAIQILSANHIDVVLVGFFQQIENWELEFTKNTIAYNNILKELSQKYNIFFADIYSAFEKLDKSKLYKDYMGDYMHHPTSFGHQLYYLQVMPFFIDKHISQNDLLKYIYN